MGSSFYSGWLIPRETSLVIWGAEGKGSRVQGSKVKTSLLLHRLLPREIVREKVFH
jgi:hypothetical protein